MKLETFKYIENSGWSIKDFPKDLDSENTLILTFFSSDFYDQLKPFEELKQAFPKSKLVGCSTAGEIFSDQINDHSISVAVIKLDNSRIRVTISDVISSEDSFNAGQKITAGLLGSDLKSILVLSDGLTVNGSELVKGLNLGKPEEVVITGGLSGDGDQFRKTWIIVDNKMLTGKIVAIGLYGKQLKIGHGSKGGWDVFGPERRITRAKDNILYELDGKPALDLYKEYLGDRAAGLPATGLLFPLMIRENSQDRKGLVRTILAIDETKQSLTFAGDMPVGYLAKLMQANFDRLITGASEAAVAASNGSVFKPPILAILISCVGRRLLMGERTSEEIEATLGMFPKGTEQIGFYSYGEISPYASGNCDLHNQTMTITTIYED